MSSKVIYDRKYARLRDCISHTERFALNVSSAHCAELDLTTRKARQQFGMKPGDVGPFHRDTTQEVPCGPSTGFGLYERVKKSTRGLCG